MSLNTPSTLSLTNKKVAILGFGNQGWAQALNLRDSGIQVIVGARPGGKGAVQSLELGFETKTYSEAVAHADIVMFLLADSAIGQIHREVQELLVSKQPFIGFSHGLAFHFRLFEPITNGRYFLASPKGAGFLLRQKYREGSSLPGFYCSANREDLETRTVARDYAILCGFGSSYIQETTFQEETESDLFGEQSVLCGGILQLMEAAFKTLVANGHSPEMAFFECCYEARMILDLWMREGPSGLANRISPTAHYGGTTRGQRVLHPDLQAKMQSIFDEIRSGAFVKEWLNEARNGYPVCENEKGLIRKSLLESTYHRIKLEFKKQNLSI